MTSETGPQANPPQGHPADRLPEAVVARLKERADRLARRADSPPRIVRALALLVVESGGATYGIETAFVVAVLPMGEVMFVPSAPAFLLGALGHRGRVVAVIDLAALLSVESGGSGAPGRIVVVAVQDLVFGLRVDAVRDVVRVDADALLAHASQAGERRPAFVRALTPDKVGVLDVEALSRSRRLVIHQEMA